MMNEKSESFQKKIANGLKKIKSKIPKKIEKERRK